MSGGQMQVFGQEPAALYILKKSELSCKAPNRESVLVGKYDADALVEAYLASTDSTYYNPNHRAITLSDNTSRVSVIARPNNDVVVMTPDAINTLNSAGLANSIRDVGRGLIYCRHDNPALREAEAVQLINMAVQRIQQVLPSK